MKRNSVNLADAVIGTITGFDEGKGKTGYQIQMLIRGEEKTYDSTKEAYQIRYTTEFFPYPCLGEIIFMAVFDSNGILARFINVNDIKAETNPIETGLVMGTYRMFEVKITENTPTIGNILKIESGTVTFTNYNKFIKSGDICHCVWGGAMPEPSDGVSFKLASDVNVYTWDWASALAPFCICDRQEYEAKKFLTRFSIGSTDDLMKNCYWVGFYSTRGNDKECDLIKCFLNKAPGWE